MALPAIESSQALAFLSFEQRNKVRIWETILPRFEQADDKSAILSELRTEYGAQLKLTMGTLYRKAQAYRAAGAMALVPKWTVKRAAEAHVKLPPAFVAFWQVCWAQNQRRTAPAWRALIDDQLRAGRLIPGYGTDWRGIWSAENEGWTIPEECPYSRSGEVPMGWSCRNLTRLAENPYMRTAARIGTAAAKEFLPGIPSTRVGLAFGRVYVIDDVEHDVQVTFMGNVRPRGVVELGALELLTGHYCTWGAKPVRERTDGTVEKLQEDFNRYLIAHIVCGIGFSTDGCLVCGEHGTAKLPASLQETLKKLSGGLISFAAGGILNRPIAAGLPLGLRRGNFRFKAALESHHNLKHNELAALPGQKGQDPEHAPEDLESKTQEHRALMKACVALYDQHPHIFNEIKSAFPPYSKYMEAVTLLYQRIAERHDHKLEGWIDCGFIRQEWRLPGDGLWRPMAALDELSLDDRDAIHGVIRRNPTACMRTRRMSPVEAFDYCREIQKDKIVRLPDTAVPEILGEELSDLVEVEQNAELRILNRYVPQCCTTVAGVVRYPDGTGDNLTRGRKVRVWLNPFDGRLAYVANEAGNYIGVAPVILPGTKVDQAAFVRNMKIVSAMQSIELKKLAPIAEKRLRDQAERVENNVEVLTGKTAAELITERAGAAELAEDADEAIMELYGKNTGADRT